MDKPDVGDTKIPANVRFGIAVRREREKRGLSQRAFGAALGFTHANIYQIENAVNDISLSKFVAICEYFGVPYDDMLR